VIAHITKARYTQQDYQVQEGAAVNCVTFVFAVLQKSIRDLFDLHFHSSWQVLLKQFLCSKESNSYACYKRTEISPKMRGHYCMQSVMKNAKGGEKIIELARTGDILVRFNPKTYSPSHVGLIEKIDTERKQVFAYHATNPYRGVVLDSYTEKQLQNYGIIRSNQKFLDHLKKLPATSYDSPQKYEKVCEQFMEREENI